MIILQTLTATVRVVGHITIKVWEEIYDVVLLDFLPQQISLVHEENNGGVVEPWVADDSFEQQNTFFHTTLNQKIKERLSVSGNRTYKLSPSMSILNLLLNPLKLS